MKPRNKIEISKVKPMNLCMYVQLHGKSAQARRDWLGTP
jgi:hypothetical protein